MKLAISGSRKYDNYEELKRVIQDLAPDASHIISGGAKGADQLAERYALEHNLELTVIVPDYRKYPFKAAPLIRNTEIVKQADKVLAFYFKTQSGGTLDTATKARAAGKLLAEVLNGQIIRTSQQAKLF